jgi:hypothetical protein
MAAGHPARPVQGRAFARIEDTLSVLDEGTGFGPCQWPSMAAGHPARPVRGRAFARIEDTLSVLDEGTALTQISR